MVLLCQVVHLIFSFSSSGKKKWHCIPVLKILFLRLSMVGHFRPPLWFGMWKEKESLSESPEKDEEMLLYVRRDLCPSS